MDSEENGVEGYYDKDRYAFLYILQLFKKYDKEKADKIIEIHDRYNTGNPLIDITNMEKRNLEYEGKDFEKEKNKYLKDIGFEE